MKLNMVKWIIKEDVYCEVNYNQNNMHTFSVYLCKGYDSYVVDMKCDTIDINVYTHSGNDYKVPKYIKPKLQKLRNIYKDLLILSQAYYNKHSIKPCNTWANDNGTIETFTDNDIINYDLNDNRILCHYNGKPFFLPYDITQVLSRVGVAGIDYKLDKLQLGGKL